MESPSWRNAFEDFNQLSELIFELGWRWLFVHFFLHLGRIIDHVIFIFRILCRNRDVVQLESIRLNTSQRLELVILDPLLQDANCLIAVDFDWEYIFIAFDETIDCVSLGHGQVQVQPPQWTVPSSVLRKPTRSSNFDKILMRRVENDASPSLVCYQHLFSRTTGSPVEVTFYTKDARISKENFFHNELKNDFLTTNAQGQAPSRTIIFNTTSVT
jgi:hypothetical protein